MCIVISVGPGACARPRGAGHLMICGGGMRDDNTAVYGRFIELAGEGAVIGVVPTATGVESPGAATLELLTRYAGPSQRVVLLPLTKDDSGNAAREEVAAQVRACRGLWFVGGDQSRITNVFRPGGIDSLAYRATLEVLRSGGVIGGTSAGAAMMCDPMITGGSSEDALRYGAVWSNEPEEGEGVGLARGMGYFPDGLVDQHFLERGRLGRLLVAMRETRIRQGWGIRENGCLEVDLGRGEVRAIGAFAVVHVTMGSDADDPAEVRPMPSDEWGKVQLGD